MTEEVFIWGYGGHEVSDIANRFRMTNKNKQKTNNNNHEQMHKKKEKNYLRQKQWLKPGSSGG